MLLLLLLLLLLFAVVVLHVKTLRIVAYLPLKPLGCSALRGTSKRTIAPALRYATQRCASVPSLVP